MLPSLFAVVSLPFGQTAQPQDMAVIGLLVVLEGVLSIDNALVLGILAKKLPKPLQAKALTYGLVGAFVFRLIAISMATLLFKWWVVKLLGGGYLLYIGVKHLLFPDPQKVGAHEVKVDPHGHPIIEDVAVPADGGKGTEILPTPDARIAGHARLFWTTVLVIELTDIAFAVDSILAAIALVADAHKTWVVVVGGLLGVILMRFAAIIFIKLLDRFPRFETAAYLLVSVIGSKLLVDWWFNKRPADAGADWHAPVDFHSVWTSSGEPNLSFWIFWILMLACFSVGFLPNRKKQPVATTAITH